MLNMKHHRAARRLPVRWAVVRRVALAIVYKDTSGRTVNLFDVLMGDTCGKVRLRHHLLPRERAEQ